MAESPFIWGAGGARMTPEQIDAQKKVAQALMEKGMDYSPIQSRWQGVARLSQGLLGGLESRQADEATKANAAADREMIASLINGGGAPTAAASTPTGSTAPVTATPSVSTPMGATTIPGGRDEFVSSVTPAAVEAAKSTGLDPRLIVAQAALESGYGQHAPGNNLFGIKSHGQPGGNVLPTTEVVNGQPVQTTSSFRTYASPQDSVNGYASFINSNPRYAAVKNAQGLDNQITALGQSGYATDPQYGAKIRQIASGMPAIPMPGGANNPLAANEPSPLDTAQYPAGPVGGPQDAAALPPNAQPTGPAQAQPPVQAAAPPAAPMATPAQPQINPALLTAITSPYASDATKKIAAVMLQNQLAPSYGFQTLPDGTILRTNPKSGTVEPIYQAQTKPTFTTVGHDIMGNAQYGFVDPVKQTVTPLAAPSGSNSASAGALADLHGEEFLSTLEKNNAPVASQVRAIVEGRAPYPTGMLLKTPYGQTLAQYVTQADPSFESGNPAARTKMQADISTGTLGKNNNALNTAIGHLGHLSEAAQALDNGSWVAINGVRNWFATQSGDPKVTNFNTIRDKVAEEFTKVYRGSGGAEADVKREIENMNAASSPAQLHGAIAKMAELAQSKIDANEAQYKGAMGPMARYSPMVLPKTQAVLNNLQALATGGKPPSAAGGNTTKSGVSWSVQ